jgi:hypothetical protein
MENKDELVANIKEWVQIDNEMKTLQKELKERRIRKKELSDALVDVMKTHEIDCFNMNEGKLLFAQNKVKQPLSKKHLMESLMKYFQEDDETAQSVSQFIMDTREIKVKETIRRKFQKN